MTDLRKAAEELIKEWDWECGEYQNKALAELIEALRQALAQPESDCYGYASRLATYIWEKHYKEDSPEWKPFNNLEGVLTQIDNMVCGLVKAQPEQELFTAKQIAEAVKAAIKFSKREWVGLTDEEVESWRGNYDFFDSALVREVEAKLKEKNT